MTTAVRFLLVPGGGGSGPDHWHHRWASTLPNCDWVHQADQAGGSRSEWIDTIDRKVQASVEPVVLVAHSLACIAVAHWAAIRCPTDVPGPVAAALLVAPADVDDEWAEPGSLYERFQPIPTDRLPFRSTVVASTNDPLLSLERATELSNAWGSELAVIGNHLHVGSDALLDHWPEGRSILDDLLRGDFSEPHLP